MMKFFRKYNKILLAVFMVLLMVVFVGGSALTALLTPDTNMKIAESKLGTIKTDDQRRATSTTDILNMIGVPWQTPFPGMSEPIELMDWILLTREARQLETNFGPEAVQAKLGGSFPPEQLDLLARRMGVKTNRILSALSEFVSVQAVAQAIAGTTVPSTAEIRSVAGDLLNKVQVSVVILPAEAFANYKEEFTEEQLQTQWKKYRDVEPGEGLNFGYYVPTKLAVQYIKISPAVIEDEINIADLTKKARRYYDENKATDPTFKRIAERPEETVGPIKDQPPYLSWDEARDSASKVVRRKEAIDAAANIANWLQQFDAERWYDATRRPSGYKETPDAVATPDHYRNLVQRMPPSIAYPDALQVVETEYFAKEEAGDIPDIGGAAYRQPGSPWNPFSMLAFLSEPIVPEVPREEGTNMSDYLAMFQTCAYVLTDADANRYVFRIIGSRPGHPAESVDEVRDRVVADLRLLQGWENAMARAEGLRSCVPGISLEEAFDSDAELTAMQERGEGVGHHLSPFVARYRSAAQAAQGRTGPTTYVDFSIGDVPNDVIDGWFALEHAWERTAVYELNNRATILVAEWLQTQRGEYSQYEERREEIARQLTQYRQHLAISGWFDKEQIRGRNAFQLAGQ